MFEAGAKIIESLNVQYGHMKLEDVNEATTRLRVIDSVLFDALGWDKGTAIPEDPVVGGEERAFLDYSLIDSGMRYVVVEAKRASSTFALPDELNRREYLVGTLTKNCGRALEEVLEQAHGYAVEKGIPFCVATNGHEWVIFQSFTPGGSWREGRALVFRGLEDVSKNWSMFHGLLSPQNVTTGRLYGELGFKKVGASPRFAKSYNMRRGQDAGHPGNLLEKPFNALFKHAFDSITDDEETLRQCYVATASGSNYEREFSLLLRRALPHFAEDARPACDEGAPSHELVDAVEDEPSVIVLVGHIGSGKTTFIHHLLRVALPASQPGRTYWFVRDLIDDPWANSTQLDPAKAENDLYSSLLEAVEERFPEIDPYDGAVQRRVFAKELRRLAKGPRSSEFESDSPARERAESELLTQLSSQPKVMATSLMRYLHEELGHPLCVAFDNVDRGSELYQRFVYALAHRLKTEAECTCIVTLRDSVFEIARETGFLDTRNDRFFHLSPPELQHVFSKRIKYSRRVLAENRVGALARMSRQDVSQLMDYLEVINELILGELPDTRRFMEAASAGNIRRAFDFLQTFATSWHTDVGDMIMIYNRAHDRLQHPRYEFHQFLRPLALGRFYRYHSMRSAVVNLFEVSPHRKMSYFHRLRVLSYLSHRFAESQDSTRGETQMAEACAALVACGHQEADTIQICGDLAKHDLIERLSSHTRALEKSDVVRISAAGRHYLSEMIFSDEYLYLVAQDTVVYDSEALSRMERAFRNVETKKGSRRSVVEEFLRYLHREESLERAEVGHARAVGLPWDRPFIGDMGAAVIGGKGWVRE